MIFDETEPNFFSDLKKIRFRFSKPKKKSKKNQVKPKKNTGVWRA